MSISQLNGVEGPPDSAVQNRLTVAGLVLATLFFSGSFALQSHSQAKTGKAFPETFAYLEVTLTVGTLMAIISITCLLVCQQCIATDHTWYKSKRALFTVATIAQYLSISQAMSAGLTELVFGLKHAFQAVYLANMLAVAAIVDLSVPQLDVAALADRGAAHREQNDDGDSRDGERNDDRAAVGDERAHKTLAPAHSITRPRTITKSTSSSTVTSASGLPSTAMMSAE